MQKRKTQFFSIYTRSKILTYILGFFFQISHMKDVPNVSLPPLNAFKVLVEFDCISFEQREWLQLRGRFSVFIVESDVVWVRRHILHSPAPDRSFAYPQGALRKKSGVSVTKNRIDVKETAKLGPNTVWPCYVRLRFYFVCKKQTFQLDKLQCS